jgi:CDP-diacylglycerol---serine O-phosphatidyltransferase
MEMRKYRGIIPGAFTMGNLFCGFASVITSLKGEKPTEAAWLIIFAAFFDFLDGLVARLSGSSSRFGVELDSLSDVVSFGMAPAVLLYSFKMIEFGSWGWLPGFVFISAAAFRLARFNISAKLEAKSNFIGMPVPAAAVTLASFVIFCEAIWGEIRLDRFLLIMVIMFSALMVSTIEYETMPGFDLSNRRNRIKMLVLVVVGLALVIKTRTMLFPLMALYTISGIIKFAVVLVNNNVRKELIQPKNLFKKKKDSD